MSPRRGRRGGERDGAVRKRVSAMTTPSHRCAGRWHRWLRGSRLAVTELQGEPLRKARETVRACAKVFTLKNMEAWVDGLRAPTESSEGEQVARGISPPYVAAVTVHRVLRGRRV